MRGPRSRYFCGSQVCHTCDGSTTWSSTLMIFGSAMTLPARVWDRFAYLTLASGTTPSLGRGAGHGLGVGLAGGLVRVGIRPAGEAVGHPTDHVARGRSDHARVALTGIDPPLQDLVEVVTEMVGEDLGRDGRDLLVVPALDDQ